MGKPPLIHGSGMVEVIEINSLKQLEPYHSGWQTLLQKTHRPSFFRTYDWFHAYWSHFGHDKRMRVLIVRSGDTLMGIVPLCVVNEPHRLSTVRVLTYPLSDWGMWYGPLGSNPSATMFMALRHLRSTARDWDMIDLRWSPDDSHEVTSRAMTAVGWRPECRTYQKTYLIRLSDTNWDAYFAGLTKKWRHEIRRQSRNLDKLGEVEFIRCRPAPLDDGDGDPHWSVFNECIEVSRQSWQAESTRGNTISHDSVLPFIKVCHARAAALGMVDMVLLRVAGQPLAYQYNYVCHGMVYGLRMGYCQHAREWGVGKILFARFIRDSFERGDTAINLGAGEFGFKQRFHNDSETSYSYSYHPWTAWRCHGVRISQWLRQQLSRDEATPVKP